MATAAQTLARFNRMKPEHIKPKFTNAAELMAWQREQGAIDAKRIADENRVARLHKIMGRSGISPLHQECTFENYLVTTPEQQRALSKSQQYASEFGKSFGGFIFSGNPAPVKPSGSGYRQPDNPEQEKHSDCHSARPDDACP